MNSQNDYPFIGSLRNSKAPFQIFNKIKAYTNLTEDLVGNAVIIESLKSNFWGSKKKVLEVKIVKIIDADKQTKTFDPKSNGKIFGLIVLEDGKETYRALYDCGVFKSCIDTVLDHWNKEGSKYALLSDFRNYDFCNIQYYLTKSHYKTLELIETLFKTV